MTFKVFPNAILSHFLIISYLVQCVKCVSPGNWASGECGSKPAVKGLLARIPHESLE